MQGIPWILPFDIEGENVGSRTTMVEFESELIAY